MCIGACQCVSVCISMYQWIIDHVGAVHTTYHLRAHPTSQASTAAPLTPSCCPLRTAKTYGLRRSATGSSLHRNAIPPTPRSAGSSLPSLHRLSATWAGGPVGKGHRHGAWHMGRVQGTAHCRGTGPSFPARSSLTRCIPNRIGLAAVG